MRQLFQLALFLGIAAGPILAESASAHRATYSKNLRIHVGVLGAKDGKPLTEGPDFKPVWSKTGGRILFFRRVVNHREVGKWKTAVHIINTDGTGLKQLTSGKFTANGVARDKVHLHDLNATILHLLGLDHEKLTYRAGGKDVRLTDVYGDVEKEVLT